MTDGDTTQIQRLDSPIRLILAGMLLAGVAAAATAIPDAAHGFVLLCWLLVGAGGIIGQVGVVAAGVEYGLRRVRES